MANKIDFNLPGITFTNDALPTDADIGSMPMSGLVDLFRMEADFVTTNSAPGGVAATNQGTATGGNVPTWGDGVTTLPNPAPSEYHAYRLNGVSSALAVRTAFVLYKRADTTIQSPFTVNLGGCGISLSGDVSASWNNGAARVVSIGADLIGAWNALVYGYDAAGVRCSINGSDVTGILWSNHGGAPSVDGTQLRYGRTSTTQPVFGEVALLGQYNRCLTNAEMRALSRGIIAFARKVKGITVGEA